MLVDGVRFRLWAPNIPHVVLKIFDLEFEQQMTPCRGGWHELRKVADGRHIHRIVENSDNEAGWLKRGLDGLPWLYNAQWSDDVHHSLPNAITGEKAWYYAEFDKRLDLVGRSLAEGFGFQGEYLEHEGRYKGEPSGFLPATAFIAYAQNHDQIGNRHFGDRITELVSQDKARFWTAITLLSPQIPLLFTGEEWSAQQPGQSAPGFRKVVRGLGADT